MDYENKDLKKLVATWLAPVRLKGIGPCSWTVEVGLFFVIYFQSKGDRNQKQKRSYFSLRALISFYCSPQQNLTGSDLIRESKQINLQSPTPANGAEYKIVNLDKTGRTTAHGEEKQEQQVGVKKKAVGTEKC